MNFPKTKKALSTGNEITYFKQFHLNFLRPYGQVDRAMEKAVLTRVSPESCEWFRRPKVAMLQLTETIQKNVAIISEHTKTLKELA